VTKNIACQSILKSSSAFATQTSTDECTESAFTQTDLVQTNDVSITTNFIPDGMVVYANVGGLNQRFFNWGSYNEAMNANRFGT
jgi:hypothetical protein